MSHEHGSSGGHTVPATFSGSEHAIPGAAPHGVARRRMRRPVLIAGALLLSGAVICGVQLTANLGYDDALLSAQEAAADAEAAGRELERAAADLAEAGALAERVQAAVTDRLVDAGTTADLEQALSARSGALDEAESALEPQLPTPPAKPAWPWELFAAQGELIDLEKRADARHDEQRATTRTAQDTTQALSDAAVGVAYTAAEASADFEADHIDARNLDIIALRTAAETITAAGVGLDAALVEGYESLEAAADAMLRSEESAHWAKSGPLRDARVEVESFARSLAPGLLLDFEWSELVNGYGHGDSLGGRATWWYAEPGYATIELSDSVAREWPDDRSKALVAHEVGHAISVRCRELYDDTDAATVEDWATAWAISMGYTDVANGTWAYGPPPQELVEIASQCR